MCPLECMAVFSAGNLWCLKHRRNKCQDMGGMIFFRSTVLEAIEYQNDHIEKEKIIEVKKLQIISTTE